MQCSKTYMHCNTTAMRPFKIDQTARLRRIAMLVVNTLAKRLRRWASYRNTVRELSQLSDRDLHDLGIARGEIRFVAKKSAKAA